MQPEYHLREAVTADAEELAVLCGELGYPASASTMRERMRQITGHDDHWVLVATDRANQPVAWIHAFISHYLESDRCAEIGGIVVSEQLRGRGIGGRLLAACEEWALARGVQIIRVRSNVSRNRAHRFYLAADYEQIKTSHVFRKTLPGAPPRPATLNQTHNNSSGLEERGGI
jgi:GNAT superfamily N-acetyltransferase